MAKKHQTAPVNEFDKTLAAGGSFVEKNKKAIMYCTCTVLVVIIAVVLAVQYYIKPRNLEAAESMAVAEQLFRTGDYEKALDIFSALGDYEDAQKKAKYAGKGITYLAAKESMKQS